MTRTLEAAAIFMITLQSYYFYEVGLSPFPIIGSILLFLLALARKKKVGCDSHFFLPFLFVVFLWSVVNVSLAGNIKPILSFFVICMAVVGMLIGFDGRLNRLRQSLELALSIHLVFFFLQVGWWFFFKDFVDFLEPVTGEPQRVFSSKGILMENVLVPRFSGLYNEPGTFSVWIFCLLAMILVLKMRINGLILFGIASMVLSVSLYGFVLAGAISLFILFALRGFPRLLGSLFSFGLLGLFWQFVENRVSHDGAGVEFRVSSLENIFRLDVLVCGSFCSNAGSQPLDIGLLPRLVYEGGLFYAICFIIFAFFAGMFGSIGSVLLGFAIFASKIKLSYPLVWLFFVTLFLSTKERVAKVSD